MMRTFKVLSALLSLLLVVFSAASFLAAANGAFYLGAGAELGWFAQIAWAAVGATLVTLSVVFWILAFYQENNR